MSSSADTNTAAGKPLPVYKRRRRRIYGAIAVAVIVAVALIIWAVTQGGGSSGTATLPNFTISVSQGTVASPDSIILSQPSLEKTIPAHLHTVPFEAGVTAIAEMKSGSVQAISGVGNPPATAAIGINTGITVVMGWGFDDDQLLVPKSVTSPSQRGKSVGVLVGSSEDYELLGYLALEHLTGKVKVVTFADETSAARPDQPHRQGLPADRHVPGLAGKAHVRSVGGANRAAHRHHLRQEGTVRWVPELTQTGPVASRSPAPSAAWIR